MLKYGVPNSLADVRKKVSYMLSNIPVALELATKGIPKLPTCAFLQHVLDLQNDYFLLDLHKIIDLSRAIYFLTSITPYIL